MSDSLRNVLLLLGAVALATAIGSLGGGEAARLAGEARGHVGDETVADALMGGAVSATLLAFGAGLLVAPRLQVRRRWGAACAVVCLAVLAAIFLA